MMKTAKTHFINSRALTVFNEMEIERRLAEKKNYVFDLSYMGIIGLEGEDIITFLQGQLTCDLRQASDIQVARGAQCNLKGRILSLMDIITWKGIKLVLPHDLIEPTINSLNKTAMLSRIALREHSDLAVFGFYMQNQEDIVPESHFFPNGLHAQTQSSHCCYYHLGDGFYIFVAAKEFAEKVYQRFALQDQLLGSLSWHTLALGRKQIEIYPESRGLFLPHRLDLHQTPRLSFDKGCYKGQEIIARMHYKATLKHELKLYSIHTKEKIHVGQKLFHTHQGTEVGELVDFSLLAPQHYLIAASILKGTDQRVYFEEQSEPLSLTEYNASSY